MRVALLFEHPEWSAELLGRAHERELDLVAIDVGATAKNSAAQHVTDRDDIDLWVNRVNAMPSHGRPEAVVAATGHLLLSLELRGQRVLNGSQTHRIGGSKVAQAALFEACGMATPPSRLIYRPVDALVAARTIGFPVLTKPNVGGSGTGIVRHETETALQSAIATNSIDLGIDGTGLVQRIIESSDGQVRRIEMLGSELFYATTQPLRADSFNYCAADGCAVDADDAIELFEPPAVIVDRVRSLMRTSSTAVGGVEYIVDLSTGEPTFFDFNPYSNFVRDVDTQLGFNPIDRYLDFVWSQATVG